MTKSLWLLAVPSVALVLCACAAASSPSSNSSAGASSPAPKAAAAAEAGEDDEKISLDAVPSGVRSAAEGAVSGIVFSAAERETENGTTVYTLKGAANGKKYDVEVNAAGKVIEVEDEEAEECEECRDAKDEKDHH